MARRQVPPLDLAILLRDPTINQCILWFEVGIELGLAEHELEIIRIDHPNDTKTCIRKMWSLWLRNGRLVDLEKLHKVIRFVERRARGQNRKKIEDDDERAYFAIKHLEKSIKEFKQENERIAEDHRSFVNELTDEKNWLSDRKDWEREDEVWRQGEAATRQENLKEAIEAGNFHSSRFVQNFFQQKRMLLEEMTTIEIEYHLHRELLEIEVERSKIVKVRHVKRKEHDKRVKDLLKEIEHSENLIRKRVETYEEITEGLKRLGVDQTKLDKVDEEVENVKTTLHECTKARKECAKVYDNGNRNLQQSRHKVQEMLTSFRNFTSHVKRMEEQLRRSQEEEESLLAKMMKGAAYGAYVGDQILPIIGYIPGGVIGGVGGLIKGLFEDKEHLSRQLQESIDNSKRMIRNCGEILERADKESEELSCTLVEDGY